MRFGSGDFAEDADKEIQRDMGDNFADFAVIESSSVSSGSHPILTGAAVMVARCFVIHLLPPNAVKAARIVVQR
jgi:hypothetical protein